MITFGYDNIISIFDDYIVYMMVLCTHIHTHVQLSHLDYDFGSCSCSSSNGSDSTNRVI